ncbi:MAG: hypothetical protein HUU50_23310, partial [Candidatus Brocadiae bacterium]|nr:hypothetical protein [Candidatus Brocadiia bacterium]
MKIILKKILPLLILLIVIFFYFLGFTVIELIKKAQEAEKNLIACRTIALRIVEFLENTPEKWPPSYEDLRRSKIIVLGRLP